MKRKLGEILTELGVISEHQLQAALEHQKRYKDKIKLGASLVSMGFVNEKKLTEVLSRYLNIPMVNLGLETITPDILHLVAVDVAERFQIMPFKVFEENRKKILGLAMADPTNLEPIDVIQFSTSLNIRPFVAAPSDIDRAIQHYYHGVLLDGISYVGQSGVKPPTDEKVKIISQGEEITWHGAQGGIRAPTIASDKSRAAAEKAAAKSAPDEMMGEMLKLLRESNALMKVLIKKGVVSEEEVLEEIKEEPKKQ